MAASTFYDLTEHIGHNIEIGTYRDDAGNILNVAIECMDCYIILMDFDHPEVAEPNVYVEWVEGTLGSKKTDDSN